MKHLRRCGQTGKVCYPDKDAAEARALYIVDFEKREEALRAYRCGCGSWRLTKRVSPEHDNAVRQRIVAPQFGRRA